MAHSGDAGYTSARPTAYADPTQRHDAVAAAAGGANAGEDTRDKSPKQFHTGAVVFLTSFGEIKSASSRRTAKACH